jgi:integrase
VEVRILPSQQTFTQKLINQLLAITFLQKLTQFGHGANFGMVKKTFAPGYDPARLVKAADRWYISFYAPDEQGVRTKFRPTFNLNRITDLRERASRAELLIRKINWWLERGKPAWQFDERKVKLHVVVVEEATVMDELMSMSVESAVEHGLELKKVGAKADTIRSYKSIVGMFQSFLKDKNWQKLRVGEFQHKHAVAYIDNCMIDRKLTNRTCNNNLIILKALFNALQERGYVEKNPFREIKFKKQEPKRRRNFAPDEAKVVAAHIRQNEPLLFYALLLEYCCFVRPNEIRFLKFEHIDAETGVIDISSAVGKTGTERFPTIPNEFLAYFREPFFKEYPITYYIFGNKFKPHESKTCGRGTMYHMHQRILKKLHKEGSLSDIKGLQWYSWKDTGITEMLEELPALAVQDQAGHATLGMTMRYRHKRRVNEKIKTGFKNNLIKN